MNNNYTKIEYFDNYKILLCSNDKDRANRQFNKISKYFNKCVLKEEKVHKYTFYSIVIPDVKIFQKNYYLYGGPTYTTIEQVNENSCVIEMKYLLNEINKIE